MRVKLRSMLTSAATAPASPPARSSSALKVANVRPDLALEQTQTLPGEGGIQPAKQRREDECPVGSELADHRNRLLGPEHLVGAAGPEVAKEVVVEFERSGKRLTWKPSEGTILDLADRNGVAIDYGCRAGNCGTCVTAVVAEN